MAVYDCFAFFNELDLLELRLKELDPVVDYFVLVEATRTFSKKEKPLYFQQNRDRYAAFEKKIIYVLVDSYPTFWTKFRPVTTRDYNNHQKEQCIQGVANARPEDYILHSDLDEIPSAKSVELALKSQKKFQVFEHYQALYFLNYVCRKIHDFDGNAIAQQNRDGFGRWRGAVMTKNKYMKTFKKLRMTRDHEETDIDIIQNAGWHLSYMGGIDAVAHKLKSFSHTEYSGEDFTNKNILLKSILMGTDPLKLGEKYELYSLSDPKIPYLTALKNNPEHWAHMIKTPEELAKLAET